MFVCVSIWVHLCVYVWVYYVSYKKFTEDKERCSHLHVHRILAISTFWWIKLYCPGHKEKKEKITLSYLIPTLLYFLTLLPLDVNFPLLIDRHKVCWISALSYFSQHSHRMHRTSNICIHSLCKEKRSGEVLESWIFCSVLTPAS